MPPKKRKAVTAEDQRASETYKQKLRSYKQELRSSATYKQLQPPPSKVAKKKLRRQPAEPVEHENQKYTFKSPRHQRFSLPENLVYYVARHPKNVQCHQNLMKSCKLLYRMSRILPLRIAASVENNDNKLMISARCRHEHRYITLENQLFYKVWISDELYIYDDLPNMASTLTKDVYASSLRRLSIKDQVLTFRELQLLASDGIGHEISFINNVVKNDDGSVMEFEKVFETLFCKFMSITLPLGNDHGVGKETATKMAEYMGLHGEDYVIDIFNIPKEFAVQEFSGFLKANMSNRKHTIKLCFVDSISTESKKQLQKLVDEIIQIRGVYAHSIPGIYFSGQNVQSQEELFKMRNQKFKGLIKKYGSFYRSCRGRGREVLRREIMM